MSLSVLRPLGVALDAAVVAQVEVIPFPSAAASMEAPSRAVCAIESGGNPDDVPAEDGGAPRGASTVRGNIFMLVPGRGPNDFRFILDSGASVHATPRYYLLKDLVAVAQGQTVRAANGKDIPIRGRGRVSLENFIALEDVDYIPGLAANVVSVSKLADLDYEVKFRGAECFVRDNTAGGALVGRGRRVGGVYVLDYLLVPPGRVAAAAPQEPAAN